MMSMSACSTADFENRRLAADRESTGLVLTITIMPWAALESHRRLGDRVQVGETILERSAMRFEKPMDLQACPIVQ